MAHAGDSRAILVKQNGASLELTEDHKPNRPDEKNRILAAGGQVLKPSIGKVWRLNGEIAVSRSLGDSVYSQFGMSCEPECRLVDRAETEAAWVVLACDGVWDVLTANQVGKLILSSKKKAPAILAEKIVKKAYSKLSLDNLSCIVVQLNAK